MAVEPCFRPANEDFIYRQVEQRNTVLKAIPADGYKLRRNSFVLRYCTMATRTWKATRGSP